MSNCTVIRPLPSQVKSPPPVRLLPASPVLPLTEPAHMAGMTGLQLVQTHSSLFYPFISTGDVIAVDFNVRRIQYDGEYLISIAHEGGSQWFSASRFQFRPGKELWTAAQDGLGAVTWHKVSPLMLNSITVHGEVREVFKPVSKSTRGAA